MFVKQCRVVLMPVLLLLAVVFLFELKFSASGVPNFDFLWTALLGALLGCALCLLPLLAGTNSTRDRYAAPWWFACALVLLVILYQYFCTIQNPAPLPTLRWLRIRTPAPLSGEGVLLGYLFVTAVRAKK
ncbi:MAG: hypothetical protein LBU67_04740 [Oscillospiraceae bacterium]|jgi:hypothetical protein|nr:hypothetical protein [Oscillospiraceae bacterium]